MGHSGTDPEIGSPPLSKLLPAGGMGRSGRSIAHNLSLRSF